MHVPNPLVRNGQGKDTKSCSCGGSLVTNGTFFDVDVL